MKQARKSKQSYLTKLSTTCQPHQIRSIKEINHDFPLPAGSRSCFLCTILVSSIYAKKNLSTEKIKKSA